MGNASSAELAGYVLAGIALLIVVYATWYNYHQYKGTEEGWSGHKAALVAHFLLFLLLGGLFPAIYYGSHQSTSLKKDLATLISKDTTHFFGRVNGGAATNVALSEAVANKAIDACEFNASQLQKAIDQVTDDKQNDDEYKKLFDQLGKAYTAGVVYRRGDDPDATLQQFAYY